MTSVGDAFGFPFRSPNWLGTVVLQGLILIIPIIGQIALLGWLLITIDNIRAGRYELAPAGFHLGRGIALFGVQLVYGIGLFIVPAILQGIGSVLLTQSNGAGAALLTLAIVLDIAATLLVIFLTPVLILRTSQYGFGGAMDFGAVWQQATANAAQTVVAALLVYVAGLIASLGVILCVVGVLFTSVYAYAVTAGVISWYERTLGVTAPSTAV
jgi:Protein of unknown function (DUF4013)